MTVGDAQYRWTKTHNYGVMSFLDKLRAKFAPAQHPDAVVRATLRQHGDDGTKVRTVDHLAYFQNQHDMSAYMTFVHDLGFTLQDSVHEFAVAFTKDTPVVEADFDRELAIIQAKAKALNGEYDGWGCPVAI